MYNMYKYLFGRRWIHSAGEACPLTSNAGVLCPSLFRNRSARHVSVSSFARVTGRPVSFEQMGRAQLASPHGGSRRLLASPRSFVPLLGEVPGLDDPVKELAAGTELHDEVNISAGQGEPRCF